MQQDEYGIYDIYTFIHTPFWQTTWFRGALLFFAVVCFGLFAWLLVRFFFLSKKQKDIPLRQIVLTKLARIKQPYTTENVQNLYADLGLIIRLFFTDTHGNDMLSFTEHELIKHVSDCSLCAEMQNDIVHAKKDLLLENMHERINNLLEKMSDIKYKAEIVEQNEALINDIDLITVLVHSVYFKK